MPKAIVNNAGRQPIVPHGGILNGAHQPTTPAKAVVVINTRHPVAVAKPVGTIVKK